MLTVIQSGYLRIAYSLAHAKKKLEELIAQYPGIASAVAKVRPKSDAPVLPLLPFPLVGESLDSGLLDPGSRYFLARGAELLIDSYVTTIGMPFDSEKARVEARRQIDQLCPEVLLFAKDLVELRFLVGDAKPTVWTRSDDESYATVTDGKNTIGAWHIHRLDESMPRDDVLLERDEPTNFELVVAIPTVAQRAGGPLYMYFPTEVQLPLPVICHATLELEQNRKHLQEKRASNKYVLTRLARFLAEIAEKTASDSEANPWEGASLLMPTGEFPKELKDEEFPAALLEEAKSRRILPTLDGRLVTSHEARRVPGSDCRWLPGRLFADVVAVRSKTDHDFICSLGVRSLGADEIKERIVGQKLTTDERVALAAGLRQDDELKAAHTSALLLDQASMAIEDGVRVFLAPSGGEPPAFPEWANLRFLHEPMREQLTQAIGARDRGDLQQKLSTFGVLEYSLANVVSALVVEEGRAVKNRPDLRAKYHEDLLRTLFALFSADVAAGKSPATVDRVAVDLPTQAGQQTNASSLYLGRGFGSSGEIVQALYESWSADSLVQAEALESIANDPDQLRRFLCWLGVAEWPREVEVQQPERGFLDHALRSIKFPAQFGEIAVATMGDAHQPKLEKVRSVDRLGDILAKANAVAITTWLVCDDRTSQWTRSDRKHAVLTALPGEKRNARDYNGPLPSYARWRIENTAWLRSAAGEPLMPKDCVRGEHASEELFPRPVMPAEPELARFEISQREIVEGWQRAGVLTSLAYLERDQIYAKLLELPKRSPDGRLARPLYHWLLDASDAALGSSGPYEAEFRARGKMWGRHGNCEAYFRIEQLYHADSEGLPTELVESLPIVALRKRAGVEKVKALFGIQPVDRTDIQQTVLAKQLAVGSSDADSNFQSAKPYFHKLRTSRTGQFQQLQTLKALRLEVCSTLDVEVIFKDERFKYAIPSWGWLLQEEVLYVRSDPAKPLDVSDALLADSIGEALASLFRLADGGEFARMFSCRESDRLQLLQRLRNEAALDDLYTIKRQYESFEPRDLVHAMFPLSFPPQVVEPPENAERQTNDDAGVIDSPPSLSAGVDRELVISEREHTPEDTPPPRSIQIKRITSSVRRSEATYQVTDGDFCEKKVMEFEEATEPGRYPLLVGHMMGADGPGCDIYSFPSAEARDHFKATKDLRFVDRFIEVKGRNNAGAAIELKGNSLHAAEKYGKRYFLYRLFDAGDGKFELAILQDPLGQKTTLIPAVHVVMQRADTMQQFSICGGLARGTRRSVADTAKDDGVAVNVDARSCMAWGGEPSDLD